MTQILAADRVRNGLADWVAQASNPAAGAGLAAPIVSVCPWLEGGLARISIKTGAPDASGWSRQNLTNLRVFNVVTQFGAIGDNLFDNTTAIQNAINAANAAGGGIVYFPPGKYAIYRSADVHVLQSINMSGIHNVTLLGDGYQSQIRMVGDAHAADWYGFNVQVDAHDITFTGLYFDASQSFNGDPAQQQHTIHVSGTLTNTGLPGGHYVRITGCYFDSQLGDHINLISNFPVAASDVYGVVVDHNIFLALSVGQTGAAKFRSAVGFQRNVTSTLTAYNYMDGSSDNTIDYEPTGNGVNQGDCHYGNQANGRSHPAQIFTSSGTTFTTPCQDIVWAYNIGFNGGGISCGDSSTNTWLGNVIVATNQTSSNPQCSVDRVNTEQSFVANVFSSSAPDAAGRNMVTFSGDAFGRPISCLFDGNIVHADGDSLAITIESATGIAIEGNLITHRNTDASNGNSIQISSNTADVRQTHIRHNLIVPDQTAAMRATIKTAPTAQPIADVHIVGNYARNALAQTAGSLFSTPVGGGTYTGQFSSIDNLFIGGTGSTVSINSSLPNMATGGNAGPFSGQVGLNQLAAGPEGITAAQAGSLVTNTATTGNSDTIFSKESGNGKTGYVRQGSTDLQFGCADTSNATTARFMAPSSDLALAGTIEIQIPITRDVTVRNLRIHQSPGTGVGNITYTVRKNGGSTGVVATFAFSSSIGNSGGASTKFAAGDLLSIQITKNAIPATNPTNAIATVEIA